MLTRITHFRFVTQMFGNSWFAVRHNGVYSEITRKTGRKRIGRLDVNGNGED